MATTSHLPTVGIRARLASFFDRAAPLAYPLIRVIAGLMLIPHGAQKLFGWFGGYGLTATGHYFESELGLAPGLLVAATAGVIEFFGGLALALGVLTRPVALVATGFLLVAASMHLGNGFFWTEGGYEYPLFWAMATLAIILRGGDRLSVDALLKQRR